MPNVIERDGGDGRPSIGDGEKKSWGSDGKGGIINQGHLEMVKK